MIGLKGERWHKSNAWEEVNESMCDQGVRETRVSFFVGIRLGNKAKGERKWRQGIEKLIMS